MAAEGAKDEDRTAQATASQDQKAQALRDLLQETLEPFNPSFGTVMDIPEVLIEPKDVVQVCRIAKEDPRLAFKLLLCLAAVDYKEHFQVVYILLSMEMEQKLFIKANLPYEEPQIPSVTSVWRAADWYEREAHDLFGIVFSDHGNLKPLILYEGFEGYPGRKSYPFHDYQEF